MCQVSSNVKTVLPLKMLFADYPICTMPLIESYLNYKNIISNTSYVYFDYSLQYVKNEEKICVNENTELNLSFTIQNNDVLGVKIDFNENDKYLFALKDIYGIEIKYIEHANIEFFTMFVREQLKNNEPIIFQFDLFYIKDRMCYKKRHYDHMIAIIGYDDLQNFYYCMDGSENPYFKVSKDDLKSGVDYIIKKYAAVRSYSFLDTGERKIPDCHYLKNRVETILQNATIGNSVGINAFLSFRQDIKEFLLFNKSSFDISDAYKIYKERKTSARCLNNFKQFFLEDEEILLNVIKALQLEEKLWFEFFFIMKRSLLEGTWLYEKQFVFVIDKLHRLIENTITDIKILNEYLEEKII